MAAYNLNQNRYPIPEFSDYDTSKYEGAYIMHEDEVKQVPSDLVVKATAALQSDIDSELLIPDPEPGAMARMYKETDKDSKKKKKDK